MIPLRTLSAMLLACAAVIPTFAQTSSTPPVLAAGHGIVRSPDSTDPRKAPVTVSPATLSFPATVVGAASSALTVTLTNNQAKSLTISGVAASGNFTISSSTCGATVAASGTCTVGVQFVPNSIGTQTGGLTFTDSANSSPQTVNLSGKGVGPLSATPASLTFSPIAAGQKSAVKTVTVTNKSSASVTITGATATAGFAMVKNTCTALAAAATCTIQVKFEPTAVGLVTGTLDIAYGGFGSPLAESLFGGVSAVSISPTSASLAAGATRQYTATATIYGGTTQAVTSSAAWSSTAAGVATVNSAGLVSAISAGSASIGAAIGNLSASGTLTVTGPTLTSIAVTPAGASIPIGGAEQLTATGTYSDNSTQNLTSSVTWSSANTSVATVAAGGLATGTGFGSANMKAASGAVNGSTSLSVTPGFVLSGSLNTGRYHATATELIPGTVLIAGGTAAGGAATASAEVYNPATGLFAATGNLIAARSGHTATLLGNGLVLIAGGAGSTGQPLATAELYNPATGAFTSTGSLSAARTSHTATLLADGTVLMAGGTNAQGAPLGSAELYNPATGQFAATSGALLTARQGQTAVRLNSGSVFIAGGTGTTGALNSAELYNPASKAFTSAGSLPAPLTAFTATLLDTGKVLLAGGAGVSAAELYDPVAGSFTSTGSLNIPRNSQTAVLLTNGTVLIAGGVADSGGQVLASAEIYDPLAGTFTATGGLNAAREYATATLLTSGAVLITGGTANSGNSVLASAEQYETNTLTPSNLVSLAISPGSATLPLGAGQQYTATGTLNNGSTETMASVIWSSNNPAAVTITNDASDSGTAYALSSGPATLTACAGTVCGSTVSTGGPPAISTITPDSLPAGQSTTISVVGLGTHFGSTTTAAMGDGITVGAITVTDALHLSFPITIDPITAPGSRTLTIATGSEFVSGTFTVMGNGATLQSVVMTSGNGAQGTNATLTLTGAGTHWEQAGTTVAVGGGITVGNITVLSATSLTVNISIGPSVAPGSYSVTAATNGEVVSLSNAVTVIGGTPYLAGVSPGTGTQGQQNLSVNFTGVFTNFNVGALTANFGANVTVNSLTATSATTATAVISIDAVAFTGGRSCTLSSNGTNYPFSFSITASNAALISVTLLNTNTPASGLQGASVSLQVNGSNTHWSQGLTSASLGTYVTINRVIVNSATSAEVDIAISANSPLGGAGMTMSTGGEIVSLANALSVLPYTPSLTLSPSSGMIAVAPAATNTVNVNLTGNFTHFSNQTVAAIDGNGVSITNFKAQNSLNATAQFVITQSAPAAPQTPCNNANGGNRTVTLETPVNSGSEIVTAGFCVTSTPAQLVSITPYHSPQSVNNLTVTINGQYTHFEQGITTVGFGPDVTVAANSVTVTSSTSLTAVISIDATAALGWRPVFVNTVDSNNNINEQLTVGFSIDAPSSATLAAVSPNSGIQGQSLPVQITGNFTNWSQSGTQAIFGAGITVTALVVNSTTSATAQIAIDPVNAPIGGSTVTMVTQLANGNEEVVSGPLFTVTAGIASISSASVPGRTQSPPGHNLSIYQGDFVTLTVVGSSTHFTAGETTLNLGSDIAVSQLTVIDATHLSAQIAVSYTATMGFRGFTATTNDEVATSFSDALNILPVQPASANITPSSGAQGTTFTVQVNGINTHWTGTAQNSANDTTASFGNNNGVNVTSVNVISATQMNLTVQVAGIAYSGLYTLTITTTGLTVGPPPLSPQSTEQIVLNNIFTVTPGAAILTNVSPTSGAQNSSTSINVTGQSTNFETGITTAAFSTGGCNPASPAGINVSNVTSSDATHATLAIAISATAPTGYQTLCMYTGGETASYSNAFQVTPGNPTLNSVSPTAGQQGQTLTGVQILGQFTHWAQGVTTATFGQGIAVQSLTINSTTSATATLSVSPTASLGGRTVTMTTNSEIVSGTFFSVTASAALISGITPTSANQGQHILMTVSGDFTNWSQELTQFSITGGGYDITVNGLVVNSPTQAVADLSILTVSGNAGLGTRTIQMATGGEIVTLQSGFLITGGVPAIASISPSSGTAGDVGDNVSISGQFTQWNNTSVVDFGDPAITVTGATTINSSTSITAVINIGASANIGVHTVTVRTGTSVQLGQYTVYSPAAPPSPYISYENPGVALPGQTLAVYLTGQFTNWLPGETTASFGSPIQLNSFQVTGVGSAVANITIPSNATAGSSTVTITTGAQQLTTTFSVTVGTPAITLVSANSAIQGETRLLDLVGQYTAWNTNTQFTFCSGVDSVSEVQIFGPTAARVQVVIDPLAATGACAVTATTGAEVDSLGSGASFTILPSTATITSVTPNTAIQGATGVVVSVVGFDTLWTNTTAFNFGGGISVTNATVTDNTHAALTLSLALYATPGSYSLTATTGGQVATLNNAFVVQPGTPILLSTTNGSDAQQAQFSLGILGQYTNWTSSNTTVSFPNGGVSGVAVNVTSGQSITVTGTVNATAYTGCGPIVVTTSAQVPPVLTLYNAFCITPGPAAVSQLSPNSLGQGATGTVQITGTNTNWSQGVTTATFGAGISVNTLTVNNAASASANVTVAANATPGANTVTLTTAGETASDASAFTIYAATPVLLDVYPNSAAQSATLNVCITAAFTHFVNGNTTANFGPGITVNSTTVAPTSSCSQGDSTHATVNITVQPTALTNGTNHVSMTTNLTGGAQEVAIWENSSATTLYNFTITAGSATISSATPTTPSTVHQNDTGDVIVITGNGTHFAATGFTPSIAFCSGLTVVGQTVNSNTQITATVNVSASAPVGACGVTVTTGGEAATGSNLFNVLSGAPVLTSISPNSAHQNDGQTTPVAIAISGVLTHFTSGGLNVTFPAGVTVASAPVAVNDTTLNVGIKVSPTAATGPGTVTVQDTTDGSISLANAFTIVAGVPALISVSPNTGAQGSTQTVTITGSFTQWTATTVVTVSGGADVAVGAGATVTNLPNGYQQTIQVPFTVTQGAAATARTVTVTTGSQQLSLTGAFTVLPGVPNVSAIQPNVGVPNSVVSVSLTGQFTNWAGGSTAANFGPGISVNGAAEGAAGMLNVSSATTASATLSIDAAAGLGARTVTVTTGSQVLTVNNGFTVQANTTTPPSILYVSPTTGAANVPTNSKVTVVFSEPVNPATITTANTYLINTNAGYGYCGTSASYGIPISLSVDASGRVLTITPSGLLAVGDEFYLDVNTSNTPAGTPVVADQSGNQLSYNRCYSFTAGFAADSTGPSFVAGSVANNALGVPTNSIVTLGFNRAINPATVQTGLNIQQGSNSVPGSWSYSSDFTQAIFTPASNLTASAAFIVSYTAAITDAAGYPLVNPGTLNFTTGTGPDSTSLSYNSYTPPANADTAGNNPLIQVTFNKPVNPLSVTPSTFYVYDTQFGATVPGTTVTASANNQTFTLNLPAPLQVSYPYRVYVGYVYDWTGQNGTALGYYFATGPAVDTTQPAVTGVSPAAGATGMAVNPLIYVHFNKQLAPTSLAQTNVSLTPAAPGTVAFVSGDYSTVTFTLSAALAVSTKYTINVSGFVDQDGNAMSAFAGSSFTTGSSRTPDTTSGSITATPTGSAVPVNSKVMLQLSKPVDLLTVNSTSFEVYDSTSNVVIPGAISHSANAKTLVFTPANNFEPNHTIWIYGSYEAYLYDLDGNIFNSVRQSFTTGSGADTTPPTVISVSPANAATGIGPNNPVIVTFSKSMNPYALNGNVAIYNGSALYASSYSNSADYTTVIFSTGYLPFSTKFTVVVSPNVTDLVGNHLAAEFTSTFTTGPAPVTATPQVNTMRPANGASGVAASTSVTLFMSAAMNPSTVNSASLEVSQNGVLLAGTIALSANNQDVVFTPNGGSFQAGALIEVFFNSSATDTYGNPLYNYSSSFQVQPNLSGTPPTPVSYYPRYSSADTNTVVELLMNKPLNPATVTTASFYVTTSGGTPVSGTISLLDGNRLMRFRPAAPLAASSDYYVYVTSAVQDTNGLAYAGTSGYYFYTNTTSNQVSPTVIATAPTNQATAIGTNAVIGATFSENVDANTVDPANITLSAAGVSIPLTISYSSSTYAMTVTPQAALPPNASITLTLNGVTDNDGNALSPAPYNLTFATAAAPDFTAPVLTQTNVTSGQSNVPVTTSISMLFSKPIDIRSVVYPSNVYISDSAFGILAATLTPIGSNGFLITPSSPLSVGHTFRVFGYGVADLNGNTSSSFANYTFYTVLDAQPGGPQVTQIIPPNSSVNVPVNFSPMAQFDRPLNPLALSGVTLTANGVAIAASPVLTSGGTVLTLSPASILTPNTPYVFTVSGVQDSAGNTMSGSVTRSFTTGAGIDLTTPTAIINPANDATTGTNPTMVLTFNKPLNPILSNSYTFYNYLNGAGVNGAGLVWAPNFMSVQFTYPGTLNPNSRYQWYLSLTDLAGNGAFSGNNYFYTGSGADTTPETVTSVTPPNNQAGVPLNAVMQLLLSKPASPATVGNSSITVTPALSGLAVQLGTNDQSITISSTSTLAANTTYTISVPAGAFTDQDGNAVAAFSSKFATGSSTSTSGGTISMTNPPPGALGVPLTQTVTLTFSEAIDLNLLSSESVLVCSQPCNNPIAGSTALGSQPNTLIFTPDVALPANATINVYAGYYAAIYDLAGNNFTYLNTSFSTANSADNTPPRVTSITPASGAVNVGPYAPISIAFNKSLTCATISSYNFALYNGDVNLGANVSASSDCSIVYLNTTLPYGATLTVVASTNVTDYNGNNLASPFTSTFSTLPQPATSAPSVTEVLPTGSGAALNNPITLFMTAPMNLSTVQSGLQVSQNGALISGSVSLTADQRGIVWTPSANYQPGALIQVFLESPAADTSGNVVTGYSYTFNVASAPGASTAPVETAYNPPRYSYTYVLNPVVEIQFSKPLTAATVTSATAYVTTSGSNKISGAPVLLNNGALLRIPLTGLPLSAGYPYYVYLTSGIQDTNGNTFAGDSYYFYVSGSAVTQNTPPTVSSVTPSNSATGIGDNAPVRLVFSELVDTLTINATSVTLTSGGKTLPWTATFTTLNSGAQTVAILTPQSPLPDSASIQVPLTGGANGISDLAGNLLTSSSTSFTTMAGADFSSATVIEQSINSYDESAVPVNATFTAVFSKPLDPSTVTTSGFYLYDYIAAVYPPVHLNVSSDGRTVTVVPNGNLTAGDRFNVEWSGATDQSGNAASAGNQVFYAASSADTTPPAVVATNPFSSTPIVPTNAALEAIFSEPVRATSLSSITLTAAGGVPVSAVLSTTYTDDTVVQVVPQQLLLPNTAYTLSISGVQDVAGNTMAGVHTVAFTTGMNPQLEGLLTPAVTVTTGSGTQTLPSSGTLPNVLDSPTFTLVFDHAVDYASLLHNGIELTDTSYNSISGLTYALSADQKTVTVTAPALAPGTTYYLFAGYYSYLFDLAGNPDTWGALHYTFTTQ